MDSIETSAKTVAEAIERALDELDATREEVRVNVISEGKSGGLFGIGAEEARVRVERIVKKNDENAPSEETIRFAAETLDKLVKLLGVEGKVVTADYPDESGTGNVAPVAFNIEGDDLGILIGRRGQTLSALQYVLRLIIGHQTSNWVPIVIDAEEYKKRRYDALKALALRMADNVKQRGTPFTLEPMPAYERRVIHMALANHSAVFTESVGEGEGRKVIIKPKNPGVRQPAERNGNTYQRGNGSGQRSNYSGQKDGYGGQRSGYSGQKSSSGYQRQRRQPPQY
jgi:spoIIIJ-associated protein